MINVKYLATLLSLLLFSISCQSYTDQNGSELASASDEDVKDELCKSPTVIPKQVVQNNVKCLRDLSKKADQYAKYLCDNHYDQALRLCLIALDAKKDKSFKEVTAESILTRMQERRQEGSEPSAFDKKLLTTALTEGIQKALKDAEKSYLRGLKIEIDNGAVVLQ